MKYYVYEVEFAQISNIILLFNSSWKMISESSVCVGKGGRKDVYHQHEPDNLDSYKHTKYTYNKIIYNQ